MHSPIGTVFHRDEYGNFIKYNFNVLARQAIYQILYEHSIQDGEDYKNRESYELAEIYENIKFVQEESHISDDWSKWNFR